MFNVKLSHQYWPIIQNEMRMCSCQIITSIISHIIKPYMNVFMPNYHKNDIPWYKTTCKCVHIELSQQYWPMVSNHMWMCSCQIITPIFSGAKLTLAGIPVTNALSENKTSFFTNHVYFMPLTQRSFSISHQNVHICIFVAYIFSDFHQIAVKATILEILMQ